MKIENFDFSQKSNFADKFKSITSTNGFIKKWKDRVKPFIHSDGKYIPEERSSQNADSLAKNFSSVHQIRSANNADLSQDHLLHAVQLYL